MSLPRDEKKIFVYGSLLEGFFNYDKGLVGKIKSRTLAKTKGSLFHQVQKGYPALLHGEGWVFGELLELKDFETVIDVLDKIEGYEGPNCPQNEYNRLLLPVQSLDGLEQQAYIYLYGGDDLNTPSNPAVSLPEGDWRAYMTQNK